MAAYYFDASAVVKQYVDEAGSGCVRQLLDPDAHHEIHMAAIGKVEVVAAVTRRWRSGGRAPSDARSLIHEFQRDLKSRWFVAEMAESLLDEATELAARHFLRGYDAVHLAAALRAGRLRDEAFLTGVTLVCADDALNAAATAEGLAVLNPITYAP